MNSSRYAKSMILVLWGVLMFPSLLGAQAPSCATAPCVNQPYFGETSVTGKVAASANLTMTVTGGGSHTIPPATVDANGNFTISQINPPLAVSEKLNFAVTVNGANSAAPGPIVIAPTEIVASPASGVPGKPYELTIQPKDKGDCTALATSKLSLVAPLGSGVTVVPGKFQQSSCTLIADITIDNNAPLSSNVMLRLTDDKNNMVAGPLVFGVVAAPPGPVPPGMNPTVDVMWGVVPDRVVHDNFGHYVGDKYFCVEVVIGNDSGYPIQIATVGFSMNGDENRGPLPSSGYRMTRAMLEVGQQLNPRSFFIQGMSAASLIAAGVLPFYHNANHKANYGAAAALFSDPVSKGLQLVWPDLTIAELNRLDDQMLRDGLLISNNTQVRTVVFVPKAVVLAYLTDKTNPNPPLPRQKISGSGKDLVTECAAPTFWRCNKQTTVKEIAEQLGKLVLVGNQVTFINRVRVESGPVQTPGPPPTNLTLKYENDIAPTTHDSSKNITVTGKYLQGATILPPAGREDYFAIQKITPSPDGTQVTATITLKDNTKKFELGSYDFLVRTQDGTGTVKFIVNGNPKVLLTPTSLTLSSTAVGTKSLPQTVTLTNIGNAPLAINKIEPTTTDANGFAQATTCGASPVTSTAALAPNGTCTISVTFTPTATAAVTGTLIITDDAADSPQKVSLEGNVAAVVPTPPPKKQK